MYESVVDTVQRVGKHFLPAELLADLDLARRFLAVVLDKHDGRYDYATYLALDLLPLPHKGMTVAEARYRTDGLIRALVEDAAAFERAPRADQLPTDRPDAATVTKRLHLMDRVLSGPRARAEALDHPSIRLSMLPVATLHDEYLFIRVLQSFESIFALLTVLLRATVDERSPEPLGVARAALREAAPLFSLLATMRVEAFRTFRQHTDGASAIQSGNYKQVTALCAELDEVADPALLPAMRDFADALTRWRQTHYRLAVRMLGDTRGTGYTEGTPYLDKARGIPVFRFGS